MADLASGLVDANGAELASVLVPAAKRDLLPCSLARETRNVKYHRGMNWVPTYCANCGVEGGYVPEGSGFAFYQCQPCHEKFGVPAGMMAVPDEVFWDQVRQEQLTREGRELTAIEVAEALKDDSHYLTKLAKDRPRFNT